MGDKATEKASSRPVFEPSSQDRRKNRRYFRDLLKGDLAASGDGNQIACSPFFCQHTQKEIAMLYYALVFLVVAIVAGVLGFGGIAGASASIAQVLFFIFLVLFVVSLVMRLMRRV